MTFAPPASRNAPCPCGSGLRYKECHGALAVPASPAEPLEALLQRALTAHQSGAFDLAASLYDQALAREPLHFDALHMRGVVEFQAGRLEPALALIERAVALRPDIASALQNLGLVRAALRRAGFEERYAQWIERVERVRIQARAQERRAAAGRADAPRFSIVMPTYESREDHLVASLESVLGQEWPHWELCIADDASPSPHVRRVLASYAARDPRLRVTWRAVNGHISEASNTALAMAGAPFVALVDHDDVLPPHALGEMALELLAHPDAAIVYSDEDKLDERGRRFEPYFKPDWNPVLIVGENFVSHLGVYRTALVRAAGGFRRGVEGAQDWDLLLRCSERVPASAIRHVPQVLYHWRVSEVSTARSMESKRYAAAAQERVVHEALSRGGLDGALRRVAFGAFLAVDPRPARSPRVSLVLLTGEGADEAAWRSVAGDSLVDVARVDTEPVVLDGVARDLAPATAAAINDAAARARGEVVVVVDARFAPPAEDRFAAWIAYAAMATHGPAGALVIDARRTIAGGWLAVDPERVAIEVAYGEPAGTPGMGGRLMLAQNVSAVRVDAMAVRSALWRSLGGLDATGLRRRWRDVDFCLRAAAAGLRPVWHPEVVLASQAVGATGTGGARGPAEEDDRLMRSRWAAVLAHDAAYPDELTRGPRWFDLP